MNRPFSFIFPENQLELFALRGWLAVSLTSGVTATLALTGLGVAALAATVTDRWGPLVSAEKKRKKAVRRAGFELATRASAARRGTTGLDRCWC